MRYTLADQAILRMTGFAVERISELASDDLAKELDELLAAEEALSVLATELLEILRAQDGDPRTRDRRRALQRRMRVELEEPAARAYNGALLEQAAKRETSSASYERVMATARQKLYATATSDRFRQVLLLSSPGLEEQLSDRMTGEPPPRNSKWRQREQTVMAYIQRLAMKNETISFFGPSAWGRVDFDQDDAFHIELNEKLIAENHVYVERWICESVAALLSRDPETRPQMRPMLADDLVIAGNVARLVRRGVERSLSTEELSVVARCDGDVRILDFCQPAEAAVLDTLCRAGVVTDEMRLPLSATPLSALRQEIGNWQESAARMRWLDRLARIDQCRLAVQNAGDVTSRRAALDALSSTVNECGLAANQQSRALYKPRLTINEDCRAAVKSLSLGKPFIELATRDLAPWYEMWRDLAGIHATRIHTRLVGVLRDLGGRDVTLAHFLGACERAGLPLGKNGGGGLAGEVEQEVQAAWQEQLGGRAGERDITLRDDDLDFLRRRFEVRRMRSFDNPAPDFQVISPSTEALCRGDFTLLLGEIHADFVLWENCFFMWCPDVAALRRDYLRSGHGPALLFSDYWGKSPAHTLVRAAETTGDWTTCGVNRVAGVRALRSAEVFVDATDDDVIARDAEGRVLGSLVHQWLVADNTHQIELLGTGDHAPRLRVGRVVVQRERWRLIPSDELRAEVSDIGVNAVVALRRLRRILGLPEECFVRPRLPLRLSKHKDAKPTFVDFRSPLSLEIFAGLIRHYGELSISEMLPDSRSCWLNGGGEHYSFELRLQTLPEPSAASFSENRP